MKLFVPLLRLRPLQRAWLRTTLTVLLAQRVLLRRRRGAAAATSVDAKQQASAIAELRQLVPPPRPALLGGERINTDTYRRFLSVVAWQPERAAPLLEADLSWRARVKPRKCRPEDAPRACAQRGWQVLMRTTGSRAAEVPSMGTRVVSVASTLPPPAPAKPPEPEPKEPVLDVPIPSGSSELTPAERWHHMVHDVPWYTACLLLGPFLRDTLPNAATKLSDSLATLSSNARDSLLGRRSFGRPRWRRVGRTRQELHPPHSRPAGMQWRYTKHGLPITLIECRRWFPEQCGHAEVMLHTAYMMEHYIRRMPVHNGKRVERVCLLMDMRGFRAATLPYVHECINVLRQHYPGRLGAACFFRVPPYFVPVWNLIRPLLDEEIECKTHFLPGSVRDVEDAILWCNQRELPAF